MTCLNKNKENYQELYNEAMNLLPFSENFNENTLKHLMNKQARGRESVNTSHEQYEELKFMIQLPKKRRIRGLKYITAAVVTVVAVVGLLLGITQYGPMISGLPSQTAQKKSLNTIAVTSEFHITKSDEKVSDFLALNQDFVAKQGTDQCYNITPDFVADNSSYTIFKYDGSFASFLMFDGEIYQLGEYFGGSGVDSMALADLNQDNQYELYFTFSWGSGMHRSLVGYFDPITKKIIVIDYMHLNKNMMLTKNENGELCVNEVSKKEGSFDGLTSKAGEVIGTIVFNNGKVELNI